MKNLVVSYENYKKGIFLFKKEFPDKDLLNKIKNMISENKSMSAISRELRISNYVSSKYYWKIVRGKW